MVLITLLRERIYINILDFFLNLTQRITLGLVFAVTTSVLFWGVALLVLLRIIFVAAGVTKINPDLLPFPWAWKPWAWTRKAFAILTSERSPSNAEAASTFVKTKLHINIKIILFGICVRIIYLIMGYFFMADAGMSTSIADVFRGFNRWDAPHYLNLAETGYTWLEDGRPLLVVFFPLYPSLISFFAFYMGNYLAAAYVVSFAAYLAGLCFLYHLVKLDFSKRTAWWTVVLISIFPHALFFGAPHTESLFLLTTAATLYYIRTHKWLLAGVAGAFAAATRLVGIVLVAAAAVEFVMHYNIFTLMRRGRWSQFFSLIGKKGLLILLMFAGTLVYFYINWRITGDPFRFLYYQRTHWNNGFQYFGQAMMTQFGGLHNIRNMDFWVNSSLYFHLPNILGFGFCVWMIVYGGIKRHNAGQLVYAMGYTFVSFSMAWLLSGGRYAAAVVPVFIFLADFIEKKPIRRIVVPIILFLLLLPILRMYMRGGWVM